MDKQGPTVEQRDTVRNHNGKDYGKRMRIWGGGLSAIKTLK